MLVILRVFGTHGESDSAVCERLFEELKGKYKDSLGLVRGSTFCWPAQRPHS